MVATELRCKKIVGIFLLSAIFSACTAPPSTPPATFQYEIIPTNTAQSASPTPEASRTSTPTPAIQHPDTLLCSPLAVQPLETIGEIITQPFLMPRQLDNGTYKDDAHHGTDLGYYTRDGVNFTGTPVLSATNGTIAAIIADRPPYGNAILIETPFDKIPGHLVSSESIPPSQSLYVLYAHLQNLLTFDLKQSVSCADQIAETGLTGFTGGPHLHFETRWGPPGETFASMAYYRADATPDELAAYERWRMSGTFRLFDPMILLSPPPEN